MTDNNMSLEKKISLTVDEQSVTVAVGSTIMDASRKLGISVPHFCWHPKLSIAGVCRQCLVKVEGQAKLQIACNTQALEGMRVYTKSQEVKDAQKWVLEFHLINHPLDCPICDQAGECKLQDYYMKIGNYDSEHEEKKILKPKALDVGPELVLDTERCILCSRCTRFEAEITKTDSLAILKRGDNSTITLMPGKTIDHNYSYNLADICPVGAFTSKDFRFKCRVWFLKNQESICPGCSTGCNINVYFDESAKEYHRIKPRENDRVNGSWMCDYGRKVYKHLNDANRQLECKAKNHPISWDSAIQRLHSVIKAHANSEVSLILTPQYTNEEYAIVLNKLSELIHDNLKIYVWRPDQEDLDFFDGILFRGDRNPNTAGLIKALKDLSLTYDTIIDPQDITAIKTPISIIFGPEITNFYKKHDICIHNFSLLSNAVYFGFLVPDNETNFSLYMPTLGFTEKRGTYTNFQGTDQRISTFPNIAPKIMTIDSIFSQLT